ncbi:MAG: GLUG motif-containing protein, partial [Eubacteriales bacterium]
MKKSLSIALILAMLLTLVSVTASAAWDGTTVSASLEGEGTQDSPYLVQTAEDLAFLAKSVNEGNTYEGKYIVQTADIDLGGKEWTPIGHQKINGAETDAPFSGVYSGLGHTVSGLSIKAVPTNHTGLFGYIMSGEVEAGVANLTVEGEIVLDGVSSSNMGIGGLAGSVGKDTTSFKKNVILTNCTSNVTVTLTNGAGEQRVGGLAGFIFYGKVENCVSNGNVTVTSSKATRTGGFVGQTNRTHYLDCVNNGNVVSNVTANVATRASGFASVVTRGGVAGDEATAVYTIFENCINNGTVSASGSTTALVSGIASEFYVSNTWPGKDCRVKFINCINNGSITSTTTNSGVYSHAGGIAGYTGNGLTEYEFRGCINNAEVKSVGGKEDRSGGIVGSVYAPSATYTFDNCLSSGSLKSVCFSLANKGTALSTSTENADAATIAAASDAIKLLMKESTLTIAGFDVTKGQPIDDTTTAAEQTMEAPPEQTTEAPVQTTEPA